MFQQTNEKRLAHLFTTSPLSFCVTDGLAKKFSKTIFTRRKEVQSEIW